MSFFQLSLKEHDEKQLFFAQQNLVDIRNVYAVMTDILHKNIAKVCYSYHPLSSRFMMCVDSSTEG